MSNNAYFIVQVSRYGLYLYNQSGFPAYRCLFNFFRTLPVRISSNKVGWRVEGFCLWVLGRCLAHSCCLGDKPSLEAVPASMPKNSAGEQRQGHIICNFWSYAFRTPTCPSRHTTRKQCRKSPGGCCLNATALCYPPVLTGCDQAMIKKVTVSALHSVRKQSIKPTTPFFRCST